VPSPDAPSKENTARALTRSRPAALVGCPFASTMAAGHFFPTPLFGSRHRHVLCVDDHEQIALLVKRLLERAGHIVECVSDGREAWAKLSAEPERFDVVVTDHRMPHLTGFELAERLRKIGYAGKIFIQSCRLTAEEETAFRAVGVDRILNKPGDVLKLAEIVQQ
jgi:CheY-like chemotaxis protein